MAREHCNISKQGSMAKKRGGTPKQMLLKLRGGKKKKNPDKLDKNLKLKLNQQMQSPVEMTCALRPEISGWNFNLC